MNLTLFLLSSHARNALGDHDPRRTPHATYLQLGGDDEQRRAAYRELFDDALSPTR